MFTHVFMGKYICCRVGEPWLVDCLLCAAYPAAAEMKAVAEAFGVTKERSFYDKIFPAALERIRKGDPPLTPQLLIKIFHVAKQNEV